MGDEHTEALNNAMHWAYGTGWGAVSGLVEGSRRGPAAKHGLLFGVAVWSASLVQLPAMKLAPPVWEYPPKELGLDVSYHLVYGLSVAVAFAALRRDQRLPRLRSSDGRGSWPRWASSPARATS